MTNGFVLLSHTFTMASIAIIFKFKDRHLAKCLKWCIERTVPSKEENDEIHQNLLDTTNWSKPIHHSIHFPGMSNGVHLYSNVHFYKNFVIVCYWDAIRAEKFNIIEFLLCHTTPWCVVIILGKDVFSHPITCITEYTWPQWHRWQPNFILSNTLMVELRKINFVIKNSQMDNFMF